jgi:hypothetical protein
MAPAVQAQIGLYGIILYHGLAGLLPKCPRDLTLRK